MKALRLCIAFTALAVACPVYADEAAKVTFAGDQYAAGQVTNLATPVEHDAFGFGNDVTLSTEVAGDAHLAGYHVDVTSDIAGDLYAAGYLVKVTGGVAGDLTALANTIDIRSPNPIGGNARLAGSNITLASPVSGSIIVTAQSLTLDAPITGDFSFYGENLLFGSNARVDGNISMQAPNPITVPASVAPEDRVAFQNLAAPDYVSEAGKTASNVVGRFWPIFWTVVFWWLALLVVGAALIALLPKVALALQSAAEKRPFRNIGLGVLAFAAVLGLVPVTAMTIVGILLVPFVLIFAFVAASLAYLIGIFAIGLRIAKAFIDTKTNLARLIVLAVSLLAAALLGMIPFIGWLITLLVMTFGFGLATLVILGRWSADEASSRPAPLEGASGVVA